MRGSSVPKSENGMRSAAGGVSIELLTSMLLLILLGICIFSLAVSSASAYGKILDGKSTLSEARVGLSFVEMKIRQNDIAGNVRIENNPVNGEPSLVITEEYDGMIYETWIYSSGGKLREAIMPQGEPPADDLSFVIAELDGFKIGMEGRIIRISVLAGGEGAQVGLESAIALRSH